MAHASTADTNTTDANTAEPIGRPTDTKERIRAVALELFLEHGYDKTSLREIAERLGVTKAALYYHFKSKEDIVTSFADESARRMDKLVEWAQTQPKTVAVRKEIMRRFFAATTEDRDIMRLFQENQSALKDLKGAHQMRERVVTLFGVMTHPDMSVTEQLRCRLALFSIHFSKFAMRDSGVPPKEIDAAALELSLELLAATNDHPADPAG